MRFILVALPFAFIGAVAGAVLRIQVEVLDGGASTSSFIEELSSLERAQSKVSAQCLPRNRFCGRDDQCCSGVCLVLDRGETRCA
ncbi:hypothetical protein K438DRAFT_1794968 [Mycena galopus ATCC 62051]|nr:hypothetical protein K438DRAFT_1794968 [Mycena galopus ATCC 62051]